MFKSEVVEPSSREKAVATESVVVTVEQGTDLFFVEGVGASDDVVDVADEVAVAAIGANVVGLVTESHFAIQLLLFHEFLKSD